MKKMKKFNVFSLMLLAIFFMLFYSSCTEDPIVPEPNDPPTISMVSGDNYISANAQVDPDVNITVKVKAQKGTSNLKLLTVFENGSRLELERIAGGINSNPVLLPANETATFEKEITFRTQSEGQSDYVFVVEDDNALKDSAFITLTLNPRTEFNVRADTIKVGNFKGPDYGSIDLQTGKAVPSDDESGDVQDIGWVEGTNDWAKRIKVKNGTEMALPPSGLIYDDVKILEDIIEAYNAGSKAEVSGDINVGDVFLFKSPSAKAGEYDYFIMRTRFVHISPNDNLDYYIFSLKGYKH